MQIKDYHIFELVKGDNGFPNRGGIHWFNTYSTKDGKKHFLIEDYDDEGKPRKKNVVITEDNPLMVHVDNVELHDFLVGHPNFVGGKNFNGNPIFRKVDLERDAKQRTEEKIARAKAIAHAAQLAGEELFQFCSLYGAYFNAESEAQALEFIISQAERDPKQHLELSKRSKQDLKVRYILAAAIRDGLVQKTNSGLKFGSLTIGVNEDNAVARLITEREVFNAIAARVEVVQDAELPSGEEEEESELSAVDQAPKPAKKFPAPKGGLK